MYDWTDVRIRQQLYISQIQIMIWMTIQKYHKEKLTTDFIVAYCILLYSVFCVDFQVQVCNSCSNKQKQK